MSSSTSSPLRSKGTRVVHRANKTTTSTFSLSRLTRLIVVATTIPFISAQRMQRESSLIESYHPQQTRGVPERGFDDASFLFSSLFSTRSFFSNRDDERKNSHSIKKYAWNKGGDDDDHHHHDRLIRNLDDETIILEDEDTSSDDEDEDESDEIVARGGGVEIGLLFRGRNVNYVEAWIGSPPQRQTLMLDTTSPRIAFPCSECDNCHRGPDDNDDSFDEGLSTSFHRLECDECSRMAEPCDDLGGEGGACYIEPSREEGRSWSGYEITDVFSMTDKSMLDQSSSDDTQRLTLVCQTEIPRSEDYTPHVDGILGVSKDSSYLNEISNKFSVCLSHPSSATTTTDSRTIAGFVTLGNVHDYLHRTTNPMLFARSLNSDEHHFTVYVRNAYVQENGDDIDGDLRVENIPFREKRLNGNPFVVDSSSPYSFFTHAFSTSFRRIWSQMTEMEYTNDPLRLTREELYSLPSILIQLEGDKFTDYKSYPLLDTLGFAGALDADHPRDIILTIPPTQYMLRNEEATDEYFSTIFLDSEIGNVFGANILQNHVVMLDTNPPRIGFSRSDCNVTNILSLMRESGAMPERDDAFSYDVRNESICGVVACHELLTVVAIVCFFSVVVTVKMIVDLQSRWRDELQVQEEEIWSTMNISFHDKVPSRSIDDIDEMDRDIIDSDLELVKR